MKDWYQNKMKTGVNHRGFNVPQHKFLYLTEAQSKVHNKSDKERVAKVERAPKKEEVAVMADWEEYFNSSTNKQAKRQERKSRAANSDNVTED